MDSIATKSYRSLNVSVVGVNDSTVNATERKLYKPKITLEEGKGKEGAPGYGSVRTGLSTDGFRGVPEGLVRESPAR